MIHLRAIDPSATWTHDLPPDPQGRRRWLVCKFLTVREYLHCRGLRSAAVDKDNDDEVKIGLLMDSLRTLVRKVVLGGGEREEPVEWLMDQVTLTELWDLSTTVLLRQSLAEEDLGKSESARPTAAAPCAVNAEVAGA